jgi:uncharacterized membrane protein
MFSHEFLRQVLLTVHLVGLVFGLGAATVADISFVRSIMKGDRVTPETVTWMRSFSAIVWVGIGILTVSGTGLFLLKPAAYLASAGFLAKMVVVGILIVNGLFLNFYTTARLTTFNFSEKYARHNAAWRIRKLSFVFGAISGVSWYAALILAQFKAYYSVSFYTYIAVYGVVLLVAVAGSLVLEFILYNQKTMAANRPHKATIEELAVNPPAPPVIVGPTVLQPQTVAAQAVPAAVPAQPPAAPPLNTPVQQNAPAIPQPGSTVQPIQPTVPSPPPNPQ